MISIILPCFNEEHNIEELYSRLTVVMKSIGDKYELLFVDDGSTDNSLAKLMLLSELDEHVLVLELSRNFGHQPAICAGLDYSQGDAVIMLDADLQHPPELIPTLIQKWKEGYEIVYTIRKDFSDAYLFKKLSAKIFYKLINGLAKIDVPANSADFRLLDKVVVKQLRALKERTKFLRGLISWVGFKRYPIIYEAAPRFSGETKYSFGKMLRFAFDGITSFSSFPLHIATILGLIVSGVSFLYAAYAIYVRLFTQKAIPGWASVLVAVLFLGGVQLLSLGLIGEYLGRAFDELKARPAYIIRSVIGRASKKESLL